MRRDLTSRARLHQPSASVARRLSLHSLVSDCTKSKGSPYSITERRVPELIPALGSQPAGDVSHKPRRQAAITFRQACSYPRNP